MKKKAMLIVALMLGLLVPSIPAQAANAEEIISCARHANYPTSTCRSAIYGVRAVVRHYSVEGFQTRITQTVTISVDSQRYVSYGWQQNYGEDAFLAIWYEDTSTQGGSCPVGVHIGGGVCRTHDESLAGISPNFITLSIQKNATLGYFDFFWKIGAGNWMLQGTLNPPGSFYTGLAKANEEGLYAGDFFTSNYHLDFAVQNSVGSWLFGGAYNPVLLLDASPTWTASYSGNDITYGY